MNRKFVSGLIGAAIVLAPGAALAAHGRAGLWTITTTMEMANMPKIPPEALAMMKARHMNVPTPGQPFTSQMCMTDDQVKADKPPDMHNKEMNCTTKLLSQTSSSMESEVTCHGRMDGVGHSKMSWRGNEHYEGTYSFKGSMGGHPQDMSTRYTGDFVKADCGAVKPFGANAAERAKAMSRAMAH